MDPITKCVICELECKSSEELSKHILASHRDFDPEDFIRENERRRVRLEEENKEIAKEQQELKKEEEKLERLKKDFKIKEESLIMRELEVGSKYGWKPHSDRLMEAYQVTRQLVSKREDNYSEYKKMIKEDPSAKELFSREEDDTVLMDEYAKVPDVVKKHLEQGTKSAEARSNERKKYRANLEDIISCGIFITGGEDSESSKFEITLPMKEEDKKKTLFRNLYSYVYSNAIKHFEKDSGESTEMEGVETIRESIGLDGFLKLSIIGERDAMRSYLESINSSLPTEFDDKHANLRFFAYADFLKPIIKWDLTKSGIRSGYFGARFRENARYLPLPKKGSPDQSSESAEEHGIKILYLDKDGIEKEVGGQFAYSEKGCSIKVGRTALKEIFDMSKLNEERAIKVQVEMPGVSYRLVGIEDILKGGEVKPTASSATKILSSALETRVGSQPKILTAAPIAGSTRGYVSKYPIGSKASSHAEFDRSNLIPLSSRQALDWFWDVVGEDNQYVLKFVDGRTSYSKIPLSIRKGSSSGRFTALVGKDLQEISAYCKKNNIINVDLEFKGYEETRFGRLPVLEMTPKKYLEEKK